MLKSTSILLLALTMMVACAGNKSPKTSKFNFDIKASTDSTVHDSKDSMGRVIEKWGNYQTEDQNENFRFFYRYDSSGKLVQEKSFFLEDNNKECLIIDDYDYEELRYYYAQKDGNNVLIKTESTIPDFDDNGKYVKRKLYYIYDNLLEKYEYHVSQ